MAFHETRFPTGVSNSSTVGSRRKTIVATTGAGVDYASQQWVDSVREFEATYGVKTDEDIADLLEFFEERRGRFHGFRWKDKMDYQSCAWGETTSMTDQNIGTGDGETNTFQLRKRYGQVYNVYYRNIRKPVAGTVSVAVGGVEATKYLLDTTTGIVTFANPPADGAAVTAGFEFDVPVRFNTDALNVELTHFGAGTVLGVPLKELLED